MSTSTLIVDGLELIHSPGQALPPAFKNRGDCLLPVVEKDVTCELTIHSHVKV
jgi:hypothetical protein